MAQWEGQESDWVNVTLRIACYNKLTIIMEVNPMRDIHDMADQVGDAARSLKDRLIAKLSEENAMTPEQRVKNAQAEEAGAKALESAARRALEACQDEAEKLSRYAKSAEEKGDSAAVRRFESAMADVAAKLPKLEADYKNALAHTQALGEIVAEFMAQAAAPAAEAAPAEAAAEAPAPEPAAAQTEAEPAPADPPAAESEVSDGTDQ
jgi:type VI protein secretion system component VasK